jgi:hypothetical protein
LVVVLSTTGVGAAAPTGGTQATALTVADSDRVTPDPTPLQVSDGNGTDDDSDGETDGNVTDGNATDGNVTDGNATDGNATDGNVTNGNATDGNVTDGNATDGNVTNGNVTDDIGDVFEVTDLRAPTSAEVGETIEVSADVTNLASEARTERVEFRLQGDVVDSESLTLGPGETQSVTFEFNTSGSPPGRYIHAVFTDRRGEVGILDLEAPSFGVSELEAPTSATVGEPIEVSALISNPSTFESTQSVEFRLLGDVLESRDVTLEGGEARRVTFDVDTGDLEPALYAHGVFTRDEGEFAVLTVNEVQPTPTPTPNQTDTPTPTPNQTDTPTPTPNQTETPTPTPNQTETPTPTPNQTETATPTPNQTETPTPNQTETPTPNQTETPTPTPNQTETPSNGDTDSDDGPNTASAVATRTVSVLVDVILG